MKMRMDFLRFSIFCIFAIEYDMTVSSALLCHIAQRAPFFSSLLFSNFALHYLCVLCIHSVPFYYLFRFLYSILFSIPQSILFCSDGLSLSLIPLKASFALKKVSADDYFDDDSNQGTSRLSRRGLNTVQNTPAVTKYCIKYRTQHPSGNKVSHYRGRS